MVGQTIEYVIDANDVITEVSESWKAFAEENQAKDLGSRAVGTWLWQHMAGKEVKHLFRMLLERVRESGRVVRVPFRCDAPELRRHMMLEVNTLEGGGIRFVSWVVEEERRPPISLLAADRESDPDHDLRMCAWCKRIDAGGERWQELEEALSELELFHRDPLPDITHGVCSDCRAAVLRELGGEVG